MTKTRADHLLQNRTLETRWVRAIPPRSKRYVSGVLVSHDGTTATIKRDDGHKEFQIPLAEVLYR